MIPDCLANLSIAPVYRDRRGLRKLRLGCAAPAPLDILPIQSGALTIAQFLEIPGQSLLQISELFLAFVLCAERAIRMKSAGLRTHTLVGVSAALFMLISKYGFDNILAYGRVVLDPSRVAAQVVSGIGFIGGGVIFMRRDVVRGRA